jgi:hypothetical protein
MEISCTAGNSTKILRALELVVLAPSYCVPRSTYAPGTTCTEDTCPLGALTRGSEPFVCEKLWMTVGNGRHSAVPYLPTPN